MKMPKRIHDHRNVVRGVDGGISPFIHISTHIYPHEIATRSDDIQRFKEKWFAVCDAVVIKPTLPNEDARELRRYKDGDPSEQLRPTPGMTTFPIASTSGRLHAWKHPEGSLSTRTGTCSADTTCRKTPARTSVTCTSRG